MNKVILVFITLLFASLAFSPAYAIDTKYDTQSTYLDTFYGVKKAQPFRGVVQGTDKSGTVRSAVIDPKKEVPVEPPKKIVED